MFNVFTLAFFAIFCAMVLALIITRQKTPGGKNRVPPEDDFNLAPSTWLPFSKVLEAAKDLCAQNNLQIKEKIVVSDQETIWITESTNPVYFGHYVFGFFETSRPEDCVTMNTLLEFKDFVKSAGGSKGFYFTNGYFTRDVHQPLEGPKVALYNAKKISEDLQKGVS